MEKEEKYCPEKLWQNAYLFSQLAYVQETVEMSPQKATFVLQHATSAQVLTPHNLNSQI